MNIITNANGLCIPKAFVLRVILFPHFEINAMRMLFANVFVAFRVRLKKISKSSAYLLMLILIQCCPIIALAQISSVENTSATPHGISAAYLWNGATNHFHHWEITQGSGHIFGQSGTTSTQSSDYVEVEWESWYTGPAQITYFTDEDDHGDPFPTGYEMATLTLTVTNCSPAPGCYPTNPVLLASVGACSLTVSTPRINTNDCYFNDYGQPAPDVFYSFSLSEPAAIEISTCNSDFSTFLTIIDRFPNSSGVYRTWVTGSTINAPCTGAKAYINTGSGSGGSKLPPGDYMIVAEGAGNSMGNLELTFTARPAPVPTPTVSISVNGQSLTSPYIVEVVAGDAVTLTANGLDSYTWVPAINLSPSTNNSTVTVAPPYTRTYTVSGTKSTPCAGTVPLSQTVVIRVVPSNRNYVTIRSPQVEGKQTEANLTAPWLGPGQVEVSTTYYDGLGRKEQVVGRQASPQRNDVVEPIIYDNLGRPTVNYLAYVSADGGTGAFKTNAVADQLAFYSNGTVGDFVANDGHPFAQTVYDTSPLDRVLEQGAPGTAWQPLAGGAGHTMKNVQRYNNSGEVRQWEYGPSSKVVSSSGYYGAGELAVLETTDENGRLAITYTDKEGRLLLQKVQEAMSVVGNSPDASFLITQYLYDDLGLLRLAIQPEGIRQLSQSSSQLSSSFIDTWGFRYEYDSRKRLIEKQVPGSGPVQMVYNLRDQIILTKNPNYHSWLFTKYDVLGRAIMTGQYYTTATRAALQNAADSTTPQWEILIPNSANTARYDYTITRSYPTAVTDNELLTRTYYDNYSHTALSGRAFVAENSLTADSYSSNMVGQATGRSEHVLGGDTNPWLTTVYYYDTKYRPIQTQIDLYTSTSSGLGGIERTTKVVSFAGRTTSSLVTHSYSPNQTAAIQHTLLQDFTYDHAGRLFDTYQTVDTQAKVLLSRQSYNELGQLIDKKLHSTNWSTVAKPTWVTFLQSVDYRYNIRGWLSNINDHQLSNNASSFNGADPNSDTQYEQPDLFGMELTYNENLNLRGSTPQYNGNISEARWRTNNSLTGNVIRGYSYHYDPASRLTSADYQTFNTSSFAWVTPAHDLSASGITYYANGNLRTMNRQGRTSAPSAVSESWGSIDKLNYYYQGNRLVAVDDQDYTASTHDFKDATGLYTIGKSEPEYTYDAMGNLETDRNKGIEYITYNALNKIEYIAFTDFNKIIQFTYSTSGVKLQKHTWDYTANPYIEHVTNYAGGFVYEDGVLKFAPTTEGRILYNDVNPPLFDWKYEYHLRDHLGNLRVAFTDGGGNSQQKTAGMEPVNASQEEQAFTHVPDTRLRDALRARTGDYVARLDAHTGRRQGPSIRLLVTAGDSIYAEVYGRYERASPLVKLGSKGAVVIGTTIAGMPSTAISDQQQTLAARKSRLPFFGASAAVIPQLLHLGRAAMPVAYMRYELFSKDSQFVAARTIPMQRTSTDIWQQLATCVHADNDGYIEVSLINESGIPVYFDDLLLRQVNQSLQENHYDPFGLNLVGIESSAGYDSKFQYTGKEKQEDFGLNWTDYGARMYDSQLGRWNVVDPLADTPKNVILSPYAFTGNNPVSFLDPNGKDWFYYQAQGEKRKGWHYQDGDVATYTNIKGVTRTNTHGYDNLVVATQTGTNVEDGSLTAMITVFNQNKIVLQQRNASSGGIEDDGTAHPSTKPGNYMMNLNVRDENGPQKMNKDLDNPEASYGIQKINKDLFGVVNGAQVKFGIIGAYGHGRIRLQETFERENGSIGVSATQIHGYYLHGKADPHNWTHGCICDKTETVFNYFWSGEGKSIRGMVPFVVGLPVIVK